MLEYAKPAGHSDLGFTPKPGAWADDLCLNLGEGGDADPYKQWTDAELFFPRYLGELALQAEHESSQEQSQPDVEQDTTHSSKGISSLSSDPAGTSRGTPSFLVYYLAAVVSAGGTVFFERIITKFSVHHILLNPQHIAGGS